MTFSQADHAATDIKTYKVVHTGPKTQLGGLKLGNRISEYQGSLKDEVTKLPIPEATKVTKSINPKDKYLFFTIL